MDENDMNVNMTIFNDSLLAPLETVFRDNVTTLLGRCFTLDLKLTEEIQNY